MCRDAYFTFYRRPGARGGVNHLSRSLTIQIRTRALARALVRIESRVPQDLSQRFHKPVSVLPCEHQRGLDLDDVVPGTVAAQKNSIFFHSLNNIARLQWGQLQGAPIQNQFDP